VKITIDTNIWVSAFNFGGQAQRVLDMAEAGACEIVTSEPIIDEVLDVLSRKFDWSAPELRMAKTRMAQYAEIVHPAIAIVEIAEDPDDDRILECALTSGSKLIVTRDKDLLRRGQYLGIEVVTLADFLERAR